MEESEEERALQTGSGAVLNPSDSPDNEITSPCESCPPHSGGASGELRNSPSDAATPNEENDTSSALLSASTSSEPHSSKVVITGGNVECTTRHVGDSASKVKDNMRENREQFTCTTGTKELKREEHLEMMASSPEKDNTIEEESVGASTAAVVDDKKVTENEGQLPTAVEADKIPQAEEHELENNLEMMEISAGKETTTEQENICETTTVVVDDNKVTENEGQLPTLAEADTFSQDEEHERENNLEMKNSSGKENTTEQENIYETTTVVVDDNKVTENEGQLQTMAEADQFSRDEENAVKRNSHSKNDDNSEEISQRNENVRKTSYAQKVKQGVDESTNTDVVNDERSGSPTKEVKSDTKSASQNVLEAKNTHLASSDGRGGTQLLKDIAAGANPLTPGAQTINSDEPGYFYQKDTSAENTHGRSKKGGQKSKQKETETSAPKTRSEDSKKKNGVTVVFHAIVSEKFEKMKNSQIFIRGRDPIFRGWNENAVEIFPEKTFDNNSLLVRGETTVPMTFVNKTVSYKYCMVTDGKLQHEVLTEFTSVWGGIVDRCFFIPKEFAKENAIWDKYDGFIYPDPGKVRSWFSSLQIKDRRAFFKECFPKWSGFHVVTSDCELSVLKALEQLDSLMGSVSCVWVWDDYIVEKRLPSHELQLAKVIGDFLHPKIHGNLKVLSSHTSDTKAIVAALLSSVVILHVFIRYDVKNTDEQVEQLFKCLKLPPDKSVCELLIEEIDQYDPNALRIVTESLCKFYDLTKTYKSVVNNWLHALPLLHFLRGDSKPFVNPLIEKHIDYTKWKWWGLTHMDVRKFRRTINCRDVADILPGLSCLFEMDRQLPRSVLLLSPVQMYNDLLRTRHFSVFELCTTMRKILPDESSRSYTEDFQHDLETFFGAVNKELSQTSTETLPEENNVENEIALETFLKLLDCLRSNVKLSHIGVLCRLIECVNTLILIQCCSLKRANSAEKEGKDITKDSITAKDIPAKLLNFAKRGRQTVNKFFEEKTRILADYHEADVKSELQAWNDLLSVATHDAFNDLWHVTFRNHLNERLRKVSPMRAIEIFCQSDEQKCHPEVAKCLSDAAFKAVDEIVKPGRRGQEKVFYYLTDLPSRKCADLLSRMLQKAWPLRNVSDEASHDVLLEHLLTWPTWPEFLQFFGNRSNSKIILNDESQIIMTRAETLIAHLVDSVENCSVTVATLGILEKRCMQFIPLGEIFQKQSKADKQGTNSIRLSFDHRIQELKEFRTQREQLEYFIGIGHCFALVDENLSRLREKLEEDISSRPILDLCSRTASGVAVVFFNLDPEIRNMVSKIHDIQKSRIFNDLWKKYSNKLASETITMAVILQSIWLPLCDKLMSIVGSFLSGEMQIRKVTKYLEMFSYEYGDIRKEFELLLIFFEGKTANIEIQIRQLHTRIKQAEDYHKLFQAGQAAKSISELRNAMHLTGDFSEVESIAEIILGNFKTQAIKSVSPELLKAGKSLEELTTVRAACLRTFCNCLELVKWLNENIGGQQELKVFVDLAMISAGESDMEIDRISFMHTSCLGFGSLIFGLKSEHGFQELMTLCQPVWQAVDANRNLPDQFEHTNRQLSWLNQIKESHGSVALTTLTQVEAINASGVYHIADYEEMKKARLNKNNNGREDEVVCLENVICLVVPGEDGKNREEKVYSLEEVKDVQSKLMLIAGKADNWKEEVDQFVEAFEGVLRIGTHYVQLCEVGEINYLTWKIKFECSKIGGRRKKMLQKMNETCKEMDEHLLVWKREIDANRKDCYSLNHFTMKQILKLRKQLASASTGQIAVDLLPLQTFMLLESVCKDVDPVMLGDILQATIPDNAVFITEQGFCDDDNYFGMAEEVAPAVPTDLKAGTETRPRIPKRKNSLESFNGAKETLQAMGYGEDLIIASLEACGRGTAEDELILWVVGSDYDDETIEMLYQKALCNTELSEVLEQSMGIHCNPISCVEDGQQDVVTSLGNDLGRRGEAAEPLESFVGSGDDIYLTLPTLVAVLEKLARSESIPLRRKFTKNLKAGEPNLLLVPKGEVFACILTLFMGGNTLPTDEEVIVCDEKTTAEEIELLWRRSMVDKCGLLFCLANADLLDYDVSQQAVRALEHITQGQSSYRLVVICSIENEDKSNMVASLDQFRRQFPPITSVQSIQLYLKNQLAATNERTIGDVRWQPAAVIDKDSLSVRVIQSFRAGVGKSLVVQRLANQLENLPNNRRLKRELISTFCETVPVHGVSADSDKVARALSVHEIKPDIPVSRIFHLDISQTVGRGLDTLLFKLLILSAIKDSSGNVWRRKTTDMYIIEVTTDKTFATLTGDETSSLQNYDQNVRKATATTKYSFLRFLPRIQCLTPREALFNLQQNQKGDTEFDIQMFQSVEYQRAYQYLKLFSEGQNLDNFTFECEQQHVVGDPSEALKIIIKYCGIRDPSWAELHHFVNFLNSQLHDCEESIFCNAALVGDLLQGFRTFVVRFLIQMSRDFATRSLSDSNLTASGGETDGNEEDDDLAPFQIRRHWEKSPHPYIFFNKDRHSMTFLGFLLSPNGDLLNPVNNEVLEGRLMDPTLRGQLKAQGVNFDKNYESWDRMTRITNLCRVMGIENMYDPDSTYELTTDNVEKILAIHMRFRCGIPVIIMGETGCGKTRLIKFMCELQAGPGGPKNMLLMKVHGGTSYKDIERKVREAVKLASKNNARNIDTVLFFDEANTTDAIDLIKEVMVDRRVNGRPIYPARYRLHFIAACNPYRKHTKEMIHKLESAGLGYHVSAEETEDKLGSIPLRQLVYRVHPLPESLRPLVWDFGQLTDHTEELYTRQIVRRFLLTTSPMVNTSQGISSLSGPSTSQQIPVVERTDVIHGDEPQATCIARVLSASQKYMRRQHNECSFVSLRDVERAMQVITWFYVNSELISSIVELENISDSESSDEGNDDDDSDDEDKISEAPETKQKPLNRIVRALVLGIGVSYNARLNDRTAYCDYIVRHFSGSCPLPGGAERMMKEISRSQHAFLNDITLGQNIARNTALSENVFMMAICTELRIPLFVIGKPGSSKSLAKDVISSNMKGPASQSELFKNLKEIHMQSYQCSPLSTPDGIVSTFKQCSKLQKDKDLTKFVSVVVLDEIGLAEDSPLMPLKTLHPLLEDGTATEEDSCAGKPSEHLRVGFIGLSNWALDPAKMNRGIMLSRGVPTKEELIDSAMGICSSDLHIQHRIAPTINKLAEGYKRLYDHQKHSKTLKNAKKEEFFGLRDFYSLVKMVYGFAAESEDLQISNSELEQAIRRNFSGLDDLNPIKLFSRDLPSLRNCIKNPSPESDAVCLINQSLRRTEGESRYLLVLTENYAALTILQQQLLEEPTGHDPVVIFGSSFPKDQHYTQICRNINRIKVCMETGRMVILLNLESLYESLYDALNQYYLYLAGQKYVDLGLGNHRVKCRVANDFKLIVVAEKDDVYQRFPIPLINRLEKHFLVTSTSLKPKQELLVKELEEWVARFSKAKPENAQEESSFKPGDSFVGYHSDTAAAVILKVSKHQTTERGIMDESKFTLMQCASPDAIARLSATELKPHAEELWKEYFENQRHKNLSDFLEHTLCAAEQPEDGKGFLVQMTTHSRLLSQSNAKKVATAAGFSGCRSRCISLQEFHTEQQFTKTIQDFFVELGGSKGLLIIQCDNGEANFNLIACCRYLVVETRQQSLEDASVQVEPVHIIFLIQLPKIAGGCQKFVGFQGGKWRSVHIDELRESSEQLPRIDQLVNRSVSELFRPGNSERSEDDDSMDIDEDEIERNDAEIGLGDPSLERFNPILILRNCLQAAVARVFDDSANVNRATRRIEILLCHLPEDASRETDISRVLVKRVYQLLHQRDEKCYWLDQRSWLHQEALCRGRLQETGTFRKALWQKLSSIVSPMLSELIAFCDYNENLNLVEANDEWKSNLWLAMLNEKQATSLNYESLISPISNSLRERSRVVSTGAGHHFGGRFPFSWLIKDMVHKLLVEIERNSSNTNVLSMLRGVIDSSPLGSLLNKYLENEAVKESAMLDYLHDFLHMAYKPIVEHEMKLVFDAVLFAARGVHQLFHPDEEFSLDIALIHFAYSLNHARLSCFSDLVHACPDVVKKLSKLSQKLNSCELILDVATLENCLQELEPVREELETSEPRLVWCSRVQNIRPIIHVMTRLFLERLREESSRKSQPVTQVCGISELSTRIMNHCRLRFVRLSVVRLFIEHTCPAGETTHSHDSQNAFKLWKALGEFPDFSSVETMDVVERFLKESSDRVCYRYFKYGVSQCAVCVGPLEEPVEMPCEHICCITCARNWFSEHDSCPVCRQGVGENFNIVVSDKCKKAVEVDTSFRNRCKSFFMELVALYCFGEESRQLPNPELVSKFIGYVIKENNKTKDFTPFDGQGIDSTPIVRSFILQQLLAHKARGNHVHEHLEDYLKRASALAAQRDHMIEVCVLCVQCMEDIETTKLLKCKEAGDINQIIMATRMLESSLQALSVEMRTSSNVVNVATLQTIATIRAALEILSKYLGEDYTNNVTILEKLQHFVNVARNICTITDRSPIRLFLLKQLTRNYGIDTMKEKCEQRGLQWLLPAQNQQQQIPDCFIVHHKNYHTIREALAKAILTYTTDELDEMFQSLDVLPASRDIYVLLALFREITVNYAASNTQERIPDNVLQKIKQFMVETKHISTEVKEVAATIVCNRYYKNAALLQVTPAQAANERRLAEVLVHLRIVLTCFPQNRLLQPLLNLAVNPATMRNAFLPTMPHDYGVEAMQAAGIGKWFECPNGHRYVITECGRPNQDYVCPGCRAPIGGTSYNLATGNKAASSEDRTTNGHIIGSVETQPQTLTSERNLTPLACGVLRLLTHAAMLLGADQDHQNVMTIVKPQVPDIVQFLLAHLQHNIRCLARTTGNNEDDTMLIIHLVLTGIVNQHAAGHEVDMQIDDTLLSTKQSRNTWENAFMSTYLNPVLSNLSQQLQAGFGLMVADERLGNDPLMRQLYELDTPNYDILAKLDPMCPALWRYRTRVSIEHLTSKFQQYVEGQDGSRRCNIIAEFLQKEHLLRALQYLPDIVKLQRQLSEKFHRRLDRNEAGMFTLGEFLKEASQMRKQFDELVTSFRMAWKLIRVSLSQNGRLSVPRDLCAVDITNKTPIAMFLPSNLGYGRCALGLTSFLVTLHNEFIGRCKSLLQDESSSPDVPLVNVTKAHLVAYDSEKDLLPMILAHSDYSLKVGEGTVVDYNWEGLERQLVDRFIRGRSRLTSMVELFVFSKDICDGEVFAKLKQKIPQVELSRPVQDQIQNTINQLTDICDVLKSVQIAIGFLSSAGGQPDMLVGEYMENALKMSNIDALKSSKAQQSCEIRHIISLWRLLSLERARLLTRHKQDPFDNISESVKKQLTKKQTFELSRGLQKCNVDLFVRELLEIILLFLKHVPKEQLHWPLSEYLNAKLEENEVDVIDDLDQYIPEDILLEHAVETWIIACKKSEDYHERLQS